MANSINSNNLQKNKTNDSKVINVFSDNKNIKNKINRKYVTNHCIWTVDETFLNSKYCIFIIINLKTRAILSTTCLKVPFNKQNTVVQAGNRKYKAGLSSDDILEQYYETISFCHIPEIIHSDANPTYASTSIKKFAKEHGIQLSFSKGEKHDNQVSEAVNNTLKSLIITIIHNQNSRKYKKFRLSWEDKFKHKKNSYRSHNREFRDMFFSSHFFNDEINVCPIVDAAVKQYNDKKNVNFNSEFSRLEEEYLNDHIITLEPEKASSSSSHANNIVLANQNAYRSTNTILKEAKKHSNDRNSQELTKVLNEFKTYQQPSNIQQQLLDLYNDVSKSQKPVLEAILITYKEQNNASSQLLKLNQELLNKIKVLEVNNKSQTSLISELTNYKNKLEELEQIKLFKKEQLLKRKPREKTQPFTHLEFEIAMNYLENDLSEEYSYATILKLKVALIFFVCLGLRISEVQQIKVCHALTLTRKYYVKIDRAKRGRANQKAFLTKAGKAKINKYKEDIINLILLNNTKIPDKPLDDYYILPYTETFILSSNQSQGKKPLSRSYFTNLLNKFLQSIPQFKQQGKFFTSHSMRHGYIQNIYTQVQDLEFVRDAIGHKNLQTTQKYIRGKSDDQKQQIIENLD